MDATAEAFVFQDHPIQVYPLSAATALLIGFGLVGAFVGGVVFKGKSGWCSSICPLLPVQRIYGQTPLLMVANTHCQPCVVALCARSGAPTQERKTGSRATNVSARRRP